MIETGLPTLAPAASLSWTETGEAGSHPVPVTLVLPPAGTEVGSALIVGVAAAVTVSGVLTGGVVPWVPTTVYAPAAEPAGTGRSVAGSEPSAFGVTETGAPTFAPLGSLSWTETGVPVAHPVPVTLVLPPAGTEAGLTASAGAAAAAPKSAVEEEMLTRARPSRGSGTWPPPGAGGVGNPGKPPGNRTKVSARTE